MEKKEQLLYKLIYKACKVILNLFFPIFYRKKSFFIRVLLCVDYVKMHLQAV